MPWSSAGSISLLTTNWQYTDPIEGEHFRFKHFEAPNGAGYAIAQAIFLEDGTVQFLDSLVLFHEKGVVDTLRLKKPEWATERRLGFKKFPRQPTFEEDLRRLLLPGFMQAPTQDIFNFVRKSEWRVDIEVSDYVEVKKDYTAQFADVTTRLTTIERKIDNINTSGGGTTPAKELTYINDGDTNGLFYWLGTNKGTQAWLNPITSNYLTFSSDPIEVGTSSLLVDREPSNFYTIDTPNSVITFDLGQSLKLLLKGYLLRNRNVINYYLRNWQIRGSNYNINWDVLDTKTNNTTLQNINQFYYVTVAENSSNYRYIQLIQTGVNSSNSNNLCLGEIELYGVLYII